MLIINWWPCDDLLLLSLSSLSLVVFTYHDWAALLSEVIKQLLALERYLCSRWEEEYFAGNLYGVGREREREKCMGVSHISLLWHRVGSGALSHS